MRATAAAPAATTAATPARRRWAPRPPASAARAAALIVLAACMVGAAAQTSTEQETTPMTATPTSVTSSEASTVAEVVTTSGFDLNITDAPVTTAENSTTAPPVTIPTTRTTTPTTTTAPQTDPPTVRPTLNTSDVLKAHWVRTVVKVSLDVDVLAPQWEWAKEAQLAALCAQGLTRLGQKANQSTVGRRRVRRAYTVDDTTIQMINVSREVGRLEVVDMVYYAEHNGSVLPALTTVEAIDTFRLQEVALALDVYVITPAEVFAPPYVPPPYDRKLWLVGAVIGGVVGFILIIWCVLFTYFKCTRPSKARPNTPRTPRSTRISVAGEFDSSSYRNKMHKIQGFDIARTEVGLENEIQKDLKRKPPEPYRRRPDGSTELEGMYSPEDSPPPKQILQKDGDGGVIQPARSQKVKSQDGSAGRPLPQPLETLHPPKKKIKKRSGSDESLSGDEGAEDRQPLSPEQPEKRAKKTKKRRSRSDEKPKSRSRKKKHYSDDEDDVEVQLDSSQAGLFENVSKMSRGDNQRPEVKLRHAAHPIKLPPLITQPLVADALTNSIREETELQESLQQKADIERWRNKQRQRERTKGSRSSRAHHIGDKREIRRAYRKAQKEIENVLGDLKSTSQVPGVFQQQRRRKPHKRSGKHPVAEASPEGMELKDMFGPTEAQYNQISSLNKQTSTEDDVTSSSAAASELEGGTTSPEPTLEEARHRMHALLDDAFSLIAPYHSSKEIVWRPSDMEDGPPHTPLNVTPVTRRTGCHGDVIWSPYTAADEAARIPASVEDRTEAPSGGEPSTWAACRQDSFSSVEASVRPVRPVSAFNYTNAAYLQDTAAAAAAAAGGRPGARRSPRPEVEVAPPRPARHALQPDGYTSIAMDSSILCPSLESGEVFQERDSGIVSSTTLELSGSRGKQPRGGGRRPRGSRSGPPPQPPGGVATVHPLGSQSQTDPCPDSHAGSINQSQIEGMQSVDQSGVASEPQTDWINEDSYLGRTKPADVPHYKGRSGPPVAKPVPSDGDDEIDVVRRVVSPGGQTRDQVVRSLREELERLVSQSSAEVIIV